MALLIIDNSFLRAASADAVRALARQHTLALPPVLFQEIATSADNQRKHYLNKFQRLKFHVCRELRDLMEEELESKQPATCCLDSRLTQVHRSAIGRGEILGDPEGRARQYETQIIKEMRSRLKKVCALRSFDILASQVYQRTQQRHCTETQALVSLTESVARETWQKNYPDLPALETSRSVAFTKVWLQNFLVFRWRKDNGSDCSALSDETVANDFWDNHYIVMLAIADNLVSEDGTLRETAQAFFPCKGVFCRKDIKLLCD